MDRGTWNYRIVHYLIGGYGLHEVYYDEAGLPFGMTDDAIGFVVGDGETARDLIATLEQALLDARSSPVLEEPLEWPGKAPEPCAGTQRVN